MSLKSKTWMARHVSDPFVQEAQRLGYHSRAAFKLLEIQQKDHILKPGMTVIDLGAAPGGWSQIAKQCVGKTGKVIAIDLLPIEPVPGIMTIQGDFNDEMVFEQLLQIADSPVDVIISDMAPNLSGLRSIDSPKSIHLLELALDCADRLLKPGGALLLKAFQGAGLELFTKELRKQFSVVKHRKPKASRSESKELYLLAIDFCPIEKPCAI